MQFQVEQRVECTPERYWELLFDPELERRINLEALKVQSLDILERTIEGTQWRMRLRAVPEDNLPGFIKKLVGGSFSQEETRTHDAGSDRATGVIIPSALKDKVS